MGLLRRHVFHVLAGLALAVGASPPALAAATNVAVAANFTEAAQEIARAFKDRTGHEAVLSFGSTGQLYTQITQGAPFEVLLAADVARPAKALEEGFAVPGSRFTYAIGKLVLWSKDPDLVQGEGTLKRGEFTKIAIANPTTAPYGAAAVQAMQALGVYDQLDPKIVQGNNISQTFQFVETGNAELGFVALSQVANDTAVVKGSVATQADREKVVLAVGNTAGIAKVDDRLEVARAEPEARYYTVVKGDTLSKIAKAQYGDANRYGAIFEANRPMLKDPDRIYPGQLLRIPPLT